MTRDGAGAGRMYHCSTTEAEKTLASLCVCLWGWKGLTSQATILRCGSYAFPCMHCDHCRFLIDPCGFEPNKSKDY